MRWPDRILLILIGALSWGAVTIWGGMTSIEQRARNQDTYYVLGHAYLFPVAIAVSVLAAAAYLILIRSAPKGLAQAGTVALGTALAGATLGVWSIRFLIRQGAPLGHDAYPDAFAFWSNGASIGAALAVFGIGTFAIVSLFALARRLRRKTRLHPRAPCPRPWSAPLFRAPFPRASDSAIIGPCLKTGPAAMPIATATPRLFPASKDPLKPCNASNASLSP